MSIPFFCGLNGWARKFLESERILTYTLERTKVFPDGRREVMDPMPYYDDVVKTELREDFNDLVEDCERVYEACDESLNIYTFPDGKKYFERVWKEHHEPQKGFWARVFGTTRTYSFLALQDEEGKWLPGSTWTDDQISAKVANVFADI